MSYPQYPQGGMPAPPPGQAQAQPASGGTTIAAGVLGILGGIAWLVLTFLSVIGLFAKAPGAGGSTAMGVVTILVALVITGTLLVGPIMLSPRRRQASGSPRSAAGWFSCCAFSP